MTTSGRHGNWLVAALLGVGVPLLLGGCERYMADMYKQPKYKPGEPAPLFADRQSSRPPPDGVVPYAQGEAADVSSARHGTRSVDADEAAASASTFAHPSSALLLARGQERFGIFCMPCHGPVGDGDGPVVRRGFPAPPSYHSDRLRGASDRHLYEVITKGHGVMYGYGDRLSPEDRWAVVAFVRALQLSQHAPVAQVTVANKVPPP